MLIINKSERDLVSKYLYFAEERLIEAVKNAEYRYIRRELDSIDLLEEIIAKERLNAFKDFRYDIVKLLKLDKSIEELSDYLTIHCGDDSLTGTNDIKKTG